MKELITTLLLCLLLGGVCAQDSIVMPLQGSGGFVNNCDVIILDDGGNLNYSDNANGKVTIAPLWVGGVSIYFEEFEVEDFFDRLNVYDGSGITAPLIGSYSGTEIQGQYLYSSGGALTLEFISDDIVNRAGFKIKVGCLLNNEENDHPNLQVYPNPSKEKIYIQTNVQLPVKNSYVIDQLGKKTNVKLENEAINIHHLSPGIYQLVLQFADGSLLTYKWLKY